MAKSSNKKQKRAKAARKAELKKAAKIAKVYINPYDQELITERKKRKNYFRYLRAAWEDPSLYSYGFWDDPDEVPQDVQDLANLVLHYKLGDNEKRVMGRLLEACKRTRIIEETSTGNIKYLEALINIAQYQWIWRRKLEEWKPTSHNREKRFSELLRYLFAKYDVPDFMDRAWFGEGAENEKYKSWFLAIGDGDNIRKQSDLPIPLTKKMAHEFLQAPSNLTIKGALRWGQMKAMGAEGRMIRGVMATPLGETFENDEFWVSVLRMFIDDPFLEPENYGPIYDYLNEKKFGGRGVRWVEGTLVELGPEQPNLSMKGRDSITLLDQVNRWHADLNKSPYLLKDLEWPSCGIPGFETKEMDNYYQISEILSSRDLRDEGVDMHHCIASYVNDCKSGKTAMYSMLRTLEHGSERELSMEVSVLTKTIVQARKRYNELPTSMDLRIVQSWAKQAGINISKWVKP